MKTIVERINELRAMESGRQRDKKLEEFKSLIDTVNGDFDDSWRQELDNDSDEENRKI